VSRQQQEDDFQVWLIDMDDALERFLESLPPGLAAKLDFSPASLSALEAFILDKYPSSDAMLKPAESRVVDGLARYIGETFRQELGGRWEIRLDDPEYVFYGMPQLTGFSAKPTPFAPYALATTSAHRRSGEFLRGVLASHQRNRDLQAKKP
jgi:hypothetical protein